VIVITLDFGAGGGTVAGARTLGAFVVSWRQPGESPTAPQAAIYRLGVTKTKARPDSIVGIDRCISEIGARLQPRLGVMASDIQGLLEEQIPEIGADAGSLELLGTSVQSNVEAVLHALRYEIPVERVEAPTAALEYARRLAQHGVPLNALVRAYRVGQRRMNELVFAEVGATDMEPLTRVAVLERISATLFEYIDWMSQQVVEVYEEERERWLENQNSLRAVRVRELLAGKDDIDVDAATESIRYPIRWHHLAVVVWYSDTGGVGDELTRLQRFVRDAAQAAGTAAAPLFVAADQLCGWGWLPYRASVPGGAEKVRGFAAARAGAPSVAIGPMAAGLEGFRRSHRQAEGAHAVVSASGWREPIAVAASDPGVAVAALHAADVGAARDFVGEVLGALAADTANDARLRETLRVFLGCGASYKQAAAELTLHFNTVKYRVGRALSRRGRSIDADRLDVELALLLCHWYGKAVLQPSLG
jgi:DNA-binding PucR family transcriptional regulator